jgi:hypothetical protein
MYADLSPCSYSTANDPPACYFSIAVSASSSSSHFSTETPDITPLSEYSPHTFSDPLHPLLALRQIPLEFMSNPSDASRLLQLQTQAAHRPSAEPLQHSTASSATPTNSSSSNNSRSSSTSSSRSTHMSPTQLSCCRCRRESLMGMIQFSTNIYYCSHCARMVGYSAG